MRRRETWKGWGCLAEGKAEPAGAGLTAGAQKGARVSVSPSSLPIPFLLPFLASVCGLQVTAERTSGSKRPGEVRVQEGVGRGPRSGARRKAEGGNRVAVLLPPRPCRCGRGPGQGLLGKWWAFGKEGATWAGSRRSGLLGLGGWEGGPGPRIQEKEAFGTQVRGFGPATKYADSTDFLVSSE